MGQLINKVILIALALPITGMAPQIYERATIGGATIGGARIGGARIGGARIGGARIGGTRIGGTMIDIKVIIIRAITVLMTKIERPITEIEKQPIDMVPHRDIINNQINTQCRGQVRAFIHRNRTLGKDKTIKNNIIILYKIMLIKKYIYKIKIK